MLEMEGWLPSLENLDKLNQYLGLSDKKPVPEPVKFDKPDPLGLELTSSRHKHHMAVTALGRLITMASCGHILLQLLPDINGCMLSGSALAAIA